MFLPQSLTRASTTEAPFFFLLALFRRRLQEIWGSTTSFAPLSESRYQIFNICFSCVVFLVDLGISFLLFHHVWFLRFCLKIFHLFSSIALLEETKRSASQMGCLHIMLFACLVWFLEDLGFSWYMGSLSMTSLISCQDVIFDSLESLISFRNFQVTSCSLCLYIIIPTLFGCWEMRIMCVYLCFIGLISHLYLYGIEPVHSLFMGEGDTICCIFCTTFLFKID